MPAAEFRERLARLIGAPHTLASCEPTRTKRP